MARITSVQAQAAFKLWLRFDDGVEGVADLSDVAGKGVFKRWTDKPDEFFQVQLDSQSGAPTWPGDLDVAPDRLYTEVAGRSARMSTSRS